MRGLHYSWLGEFNFDSRLHTNDYISRNADWSLSIFWKAAYPPQFCYAPHSTDPNNSYSFYLMLSLVWRICNFIRGRVICDDLTSDAIYCNRSTRVWTIHPIIVIPETHSGGWWFHNDEEMEVAICHLLRMQKVRFLPRRNEWPTKKILYPFEGSNLGSEWADSSSQKFCEALN